MNDSTDRPLDLVPLDGSDRRASPRAQAAGTPLDPAATLQATVVLRRSGDGPAAGADPADVETVTSALTGYGVRVLEVQAASRRVRIEASVATAERVFGTRLEAASTDGAPHRHRRGTLSIPAELAGVVTAVLGLDDRPQARAQLRRAASASAAGFTPVELGRVYGFPDGDGAGTRIAIVELGGGFGQHDLTAYFGGLGVPMPTVTAVGVDGATNVAGGDPQGADGEVLLDIEVAGALAPAAELLVYFAPNSDAGFLDAVAEAAHATPAPAAISISWGQSEDEWTAQARRALDEAMADAVALGVTVTVAAGDNGSADGESSGEHVDFPASSPHALACGGTRLVASGGTATSETVWNDGDGGGATGGGVSDAFPRPDWQASAGVPARAGGGRGVPDVAAVADPETGYRVLVDGVAAVYGGTSAVAPLWAALVARLVQSLGRPLGLLQPALYAAPDAFRDITSGSNGAFSAREGWDACTGLGVPVGTALLSALQRSAPDA